MPSTSCPVTIQHQMLANRVDLKRFIASITGRATSLTAEDVNANQATLQNRIAHRSVLVIGGAGTIGSAFVKSILPYRPKRLFVVDTNENALTELVRDIRSTADLPIPEELRFYPIDLGDAVFARLFGSEGPFEIVANFAAHKHVRSEKDHFSIEAMLENNVIRAKKLLDLLLESPPERFFCVSTDKATNPFNIMGASKLLMERVIMAYSSRLPLTTARFANVAFSNGSLLDGFLHRLNKHQPLSSPMDIHRYFVSPEESGQICMLACLLGNPAEIFFPKLDAADDLVAFSDIAEQLLEELGLQPDYCDTDEEARQKAKSWQEGTNGYPVYFFRSDTTGEKEFEEFCEANESVDFSRFQSLGVIQNPVQHSIEEINSVISSLQAEFEDPHTDKQGIVALMQGVLPNFQHSETGKNLDQQM